MRKGREHLVYEVVRRRRRGETIRGISRGLGVARKTVRRILREWQARREEGDDALQRELPSGRAPRASKLDRFRGVIQELVAQYPDLRATRLLEELQARGFDGSYTIVREHLNAIRPKPSRRPATPVVTSPGKQGQFDWSPYKLADGSPLYAFSNALGYSRLQYIAFTQDMRQPTIFRQLRASFEAHRGIAEEYVTDSMPGIVDRWELGRPVLNVRAVDFAAFYGFTWHIAPRGQGQYKGKVERPFRYLEESFFNGRTFHTLAQAQQALSWWLAERCNVRAHRSLGKRRPVDVWRQEEIAALAPLPTHRWDDRELAHRLVDGYGYVRFESNRYRAPDVSPGEYVYVRASDTEVGLYDRRAGHVATHPRAARGADAWVPSPQTDRRPSRRPIAELVECFGAWSEAAHRYATTLRKRRHYAGVHLARILGLRERYVAEDILAAIAHAERYQAYDAAAVERILALQATPRTLQDKLAARARARIQDTMHTTPIRQRGLGDYGRLLQAPGAGDDDSTPCAPEESPHADAPTQTSDREEAKPAPPQTPST